MASAQQLRSSPTAGEPFVPAGSAAAPPVCPLCGAADTQTAFSDNGRELRACRVCELFFVHPYPASDRQYERVASGDYNEIDLLDCERRYQGERLYYERHFPLIAEESRCATSLLDVGCGTGHLLERFAANRAMHRVGIELNPQAAQFARSISGCNVLEVPFEHFHAERAFDVITMINVFSHLPSFDGTFRALRAALAPGGKVLLRTSEMSRRVNRWNQLHWGIPDDLHFLGLGTLEFLCAKYGFTVTRHIRTPFEEELFRRSRWRQMGRNPGLNLVKRAALRAPGALPTLQKLYTATLGQRLFVSFIVLEPIARPSQAPPAVPERRRGRI